MKRLHVDRLDIEDTARTSATRSGRCAASGEGTGDPGQELALIDGTALISRLAARTPIDHNRNFMLFALSRGAAQATGHSPDVQCSSRAFRQPPDPEEAANSAATADGAPSCTHCRSIQSSN